VLQLDGELEAALLLARKKAWFKVDTVPSYS